jgi:PEP-CTERM motif
MRCQIRSERCGALRARRIAPPLITMSLLVVSVLLSPSNARADIFQSVGPLPSGDDVNSSTLNPFPLIAVSSIASTPPGQCSWINTGLTTFVAANPADGTGPSGQAWSYGWAGAAAEAKVEAGIKVLDYFPFVVTQPSVATAKPVGGVRPQGPTGELGGAVLNLKYTPQEGAPAINNLHWIQAYTGTVRGTAFGPILDNDPDHPYQSQAKDTPFYDVPFFAGTLAGGGGYFVDRPFVSEAEYESNPVASVQFQVILAGDDTSVVDGVTQNKLTLYGGEWWGYIYTASETTPEPSTFVLMALGGSGLLFFRSMAGRKRAA